MAGVGVTLLVLQVSAALLVALDEEWLSTKAISVAGTAVARPRAEVTNPGVPKFSQRFSQKEQNTYQNSAA